MPFNDQDENKKDTSFISEKIKQRPINRKKLLRRTIITASMAVVFGLVSCLTFLLLQPLLSDRLYPESQPEKISLPEESASDELTPENVQKYKFEGKELDRTFGLDNYDVHARQYFAMMPSWDRIDKKAEDYYPYGGVIGDISTNENLQKYKYEGKELDRTFGLDNYDIHARQYFAMMPTWDKVDPMAEFNFKGSPYAYCSGNPVNYGDYDGCDYWSTDNPDAIKQFLYEYNSGIGFCNYDFDGWQHTSDIDFINGLSYDDESNYYFLTLPFIDDDAFGVRCKIFSNKWIPSTESLMFSALEFSVGNRFKDLWNKQSASFKSPIAYDILHRFPYKVKTSPSIVYKMIIPNTIEKIGKSIGVIGAGIGAHHIYSNVSNNKSVGVGDALSLSLIIFGLCASSSVSLPVCGVYMISDLITYNLTSKTIDEHLNGKWNLDFPE